MKKQIIFTLLLSVSACKSTPENSFSYISQCKMKDSEVYGKIVPIRFEPAAVRGQTGQVTARFSILESGELGDIEILNAQPKRIFDRNTRRTLNQVECKPVLVDGKPAKVINQVVTLNFDHTA